MTVNNSKLTYSEKRLQKKTEIKDKIAFHLNCLCECEKCKIKYYFLSFGEVVTY